MHTSNILGSGLGSRQGHKLRLPAARQGGTASPAEAVLERVAVSALRAHVLAQRRSRWSATPGCSSKARGFYASACLRLIEQHAALGKEGLGPLLSR